ncbi:uncharacterized protein LOC123550881 [Mercenaria mercenaria]|uniref:uncharacterized protein LOC123550881 n=1 Tax=Mercenaria mercenaria TaxID=6596 RepID=UPI00234F4CC0|nr:uncharacterized protein LOC123550881 [Mercenaria mercenaria]
MSLDRLFPCEIDLTINERELAFIQTGIESLVRQIYDVIDTHAQPLLEWQKMKLREVSKLDLVERDTIEYILKVGSFYDRTKIIYPDEFDFILVFGTFEMPKDDIADHLFGFGSLHLYDEIKNILTKKEVSENLFYKQNESGSRIVFGEFVANNGPAVKLKFYYFKHGCNAKELYVDLVPVFKVLDEHLDLKVDKMCSLPEFANAVVNTGSFLITRYSISFTETEVEFIRNRLSPQHIKAYKILKYLINGNNDGERLNNYCAPRDLDNIHISSYKIKTCMIFHQNVCANESSSVVRCICDVLCDLYTCWKSRRWRNLVQGLDNNIQYRGSYRNLNRGRRHRKRGGELLVNILKEMTMLNTFNDCRFKVSIEPWAISILREIEVRTVMEETLQHLEFHCYRQQHSISHGM